MPWNGLINLKGWAFPVDGKKILVVDEPGFAKVCGALLRLNGFAVETSAGAELAEPQPAVDGYDLVITSFPYGAEVVETMREGSVPLLVLADCLSRDLLESVRSVRKSCCLIKPLDFEKFNSVVSRMIGGHDTFAGGYEIV